MTEGIKLVLAWVLIHSNAPVEVREAALLAALDGAKAATRGIGALDYTFWRNLEGRDFFTRIKAVRAATGAGLKEAKEAVEARYSENGRGYWLDRS